MADVLGVRYHERGHALVIERDDAYRVVMAACVRLTGCKVEWARDPDAAFEALDRSGPDLVVWGVSDEQASHRARLIAEFRLRTDAPLVLVDGGPETAQIDLEAGADQWLPKPFVPGALVGAIRAVLRKSTNPIVQVASRFEVRGMVLDGTKRSLTFQGMEVPLTGQEWDLFSILLNSPNRFLGARDILRLGWRAGDHGPEQVRTYVRRLRQKLDPLDLPCRLLSQHGRGYCLVFD